MNSEYTRLFRSLLTDNPIHQEPVRFLRRILGNSSQASRRAALVILAALYVFTLFMLNLSGDACTEYLLGFEMFVVTLGMVLSMHGAISGERERLTWDSLTMTGLTPGQMIVGKVLWRIVLLLFYMALCMPLLLLSNSLEHFDSGSGIGKILRMQVLIFSWGILVLGFSLWVSAHTRRNVVSLLLITLSILGIGIGLPLLFAIAGIELNENDPRILAKMLFGYVLTTNPLMSYSNILHPDSWRHQNGHYFPFALVPWLYIGVGLAFLGATWRKLWEMEEPRGKI